MEPQSSLLETGPAGLSSVLQGNAAFALDLYRELKAGEGNLFFSPHSISTALAMTYAGARADTEAQMAQVLHFTVGQQEIHPSFAALAARLEAVQEAGAVQLSQANALWPHDEYVFLQEYLELVRAYYGAAIFAVNYGHTEAARLRINTWVEEQTQNRIVDLIQEGVLTGNTRLVLVNAIYFKGNWAGQFDKDLTELAPFQSTATRTVQVPMMTQERSFGYTETGLCQILEMPYVGESLSMIVLLPREVGGLAKLEAALTVDNLHGWTQMLRVMEVEVHLPRFKMRSGFELSATLQAMGMADAFDAARADFAGMDGRAALYISAALHQAFVDVNEEGTEAAAATAVVMGLRSMPMPSPVFRADHPFLFLIRERQTGSILFMGRVIEPRSEAS